MSESWPHKKEVFDYRDALPFPEALKDLKKPVIILNMNDELASEGCKRSLRLIFGDIDSAFERGVQTDEGLARRAYFEDDIRTDLHIKQSVVEFHRTKLFDLPKESEQYYELTTQPTDYRDGRFALWDIPAADAIAAFNLSKKDYKDAEIIIIPPAENDLAPYVEASQHIFGKTPHFLQYTIIRYDGYSWHLSEYRPGLRSFIGEVSGEI